MKVRHVLGISGGKDSAALAIYMKNKYPELDIEYYTSDTGKELPETYELIDKLENYLGKKILRVVAAEGSVHDPFDHFLEVYGGFLPSTNARWCTKKLKLEPFEEFVGNDLVISYVGIRGDENRDGYISKKSNIQSIFPFRKNIWSEDVIGLTLNNKRIKENLELSEKLGITSARFIQILTKEISSTFNQSQKLDFLLEADTLGFNKLVYEIQKGLDFPIGKTTSFPLVDNEDNLVKENIFQLLKDSGVGIPGYYEPKEFEVAGVKGTYSRSRSGCFFCFFQQKIEWVWLYEQHYDRFLLALEYEKAGYTWNQEETLLELTKPERIVQIKEDYLKRVKRNQNNTNSNLLLDLLNEDEEGCASCFI